MMAWISGDARLFFVLAPIMLALTALVFDARAQETNQRPVQLGSAAGQASEAANASARTSAPVDFHKAWFPVQNLNAGLSAPEHALNRATPRATLESFLNLTAKDRHASAAHLLDLGLIPQAEQATRGPELAQKLDEIFSRRVWVSWSEIPDRPDGMRVIGSDNNQAAGEPRRSLRIYTLELQDRPVSLRLNRIKTPDQPAVWVFSAQTVENIEPLYAQYGPGVLEQRLPQWLKDEGIGDLPVFKLLLLPLLLALAGAVAWAIFRTVKLAAQHTRPHWLGLVVRKSAAPVALLSLCSVAQLSIRALLPLSGPVNSVLQPILLFGTIAAIIWLILRGFDTVLDFASEKYVSDIGREKNDASRRLYTNLSIARRVALLIAFIVAVGLLLSNLEVYQTVGLSLLASAGAISLIFGFAAQTILGNILASLQIAISKQIRIGDSVFYEGQWGNVEEINYTYVLIRIWDDRRLVVPVQYFVSNPFENWSIKTSHLLGTIDVKLDHRTDVEALRKKFAQIVKKDKNWDGKVEPQTLVVSHDDDGMTVRFYASATNSSEAWYLECSMREQMLAHIRKLDAEAILPHQRIILEQSENADGAASGHGRSTAK